jgi:hypothetical protein
MSNGKNGNRKASPENMKRAQDALKTFAAVKQKYGDPEELDAESINDIKTIYDSMIKTFDECSLKPGKDTQKSLKGYMRRVDARYNILNPPAGKDEAVEPEYIDNEPADGLPEQEDYQTLAPEVEEQSARANATGTNRPSTDDLRAQAKKKYDHFDEGIERMSKWLEDARARDEEYKAKSEKERAEKAASEAADSERWAAIKNEFNEASKRWDAAGTQQS